jgi:hypothetical protein
MGIKLSNNAFGTLAAGINSSATSITLTSGQGARFPTLGAGDYFYATLIDTSNNLEIVKCTARSTDVLTVVRAQESTTARAYVTGDRIEIRLTAQTFIDAVNEIGPTQVSDEANSSTGYFDLPSGTTAQRPGSPNGGMIRHNTTTGYIEYYDPSTSQWVGVGEFTASGGTVTTSGGYKYHVFSSSGTFTVSQGVKSVEVLTVAGGASGGSRGSTIGLQGGGGGGAGGVFYSTLSVTTGLYTVTIGAGGAGVTGITQGNNGSNSQFQGLTAAVGGGGGGAYNGGTVNGKSGGSGGGGGRDQVSTGGAGTSGQGNAGGNCPSSSSTAAGGGGGAGAVGGNGYGTGGAGAGGVGTSTYSAWGAATGTGENSGGTYYYAGGGGGAGYGSTSNRGAGGLGGGGRGGIENTDGAFSGSANTGGGGGADSSTGQNGGSGIVIVRYTI